MFRFVTDPIRAIKRRMAITVVLAIAAALACAKWSMSPLGSLAVTAPALRKGSNPQAVPDGQEKPLDKRAFAIQLWRTPPKAVETAARSAESPRPLNLQLIGITNEGGQYHAAVYDVGADRLVIVTSGDRIGQFLITSVSPNSVELSDGQVKQSLALLQERS